jgi:hypothetical protein
MYNDCGNTQEYAMRINTVTKSRQGIIKSIKNQQSHETQQNLKVCDYRLGIFRKWLPVHQCETSSKLLRCSWEGFLPSTSNIRGKRERSSPPWPQQSLVARRPGATLLPLRFGNCDQVRGRAQLLTRHQHRSP